MSKSVYRHVVQVVAALIGVAGAAFLILAVKWALESVLGADYIMLVFCIFFVLLSVVMIWTAYRTISAYSAESIKLLSALLSIFLFGWLSEYFQPAFERAFQSETAELIALLGVLPIFLAFICYRVVVAVLRRLTLNNETE